MIYLILYFILRLSISLGVFLLSFLVLFFMWNHALKCELQLTCKSRRISLKRIVRINREISPAAGADLPGYFF